MVDYKENTDVLEEKVEQEESSLEDSFVGADDNALACFSIFKLSNLVIGRIAPCLFLMRRTAVTTSSE